MARIGICEDQPPIRKVLVRALAQAGYDVEVAHTGAEGLRRFRPPTRLDAIIMDIGLPDADGRDVVLALKAARQEAPVLFLTAYGDTHDKLQGFAAGADDYVVKPFEVREVLARVAVLVHRNSATPAGTLPPGVELDPFGHAFRTTTGEVLLTPTEFRMLAAIAARPGQVVRRAAVVAAGWPDGAIVNENTIDSFIRRIRSKMTSVDAPVMIDTVRGIGFRLTEARRE